MRLFRLTFATILQRKAWAICAFAVIVLPFALPFISSATEKPLLVQPARILAAWGTLWVCTLFWGLFTAAHEGETNAKTGVGYLDNMLKLEENPILQSVWLFSPHYRFADLTQRLYFKTGALPTQAFWTMALYFAGIFAVYAGISRLCFRTKISA